MTQQDWITEQMQMEESYMRVAEARAQADKALEMGPTNRVITPKQARLCTLLELAEDELDRGKAGRPWGWLVELSSTIQAYQMSVGAPMNTTERWLAALRSIGGAANPIQGVKDAGRSGGE